MSITIKHVEDKKDLKKFILFPFKLFKGNKYWVPPLLMDEYKTLMKEKNPAFDFCEASYWLAYRDNEIVGRICGIIHHKFNEKFNEQTARFGWVDFIDDYEVSELLFKTVETWAKEKGMNTIHGPLGFTDFDAEGMLIEGFEELSTYGAGYNYPYYQHHIEKYNYAKDADWIEFQVTLDAKLPEKVKRIAELVAQREALHMLKVKNSKEFGGYAKEIFHLINEAYKDLYGFVELSDKQIDLYVKAYLGFIKPDYLPVVLDKNNKVVAFGITMPSLSRAVQKSSGRLFPFGFIHILKAMKKNEYADLYLTAVHPDYQNKGVNAMLIAYIHDTFTRHNVRYVETNRELEGNAKIQAQWRFFESRQHKRRRCYKKGL